MKRYLSKGNIICGIVAILFLIMAAFYSEEATLTLEAIKEAIPMSSERLDPGNDGKIVLVSGPIYVDGYSAWDETFDADIDAPILRRTVEMYQWVRYFDSHNDEYYQREWSDANPIYYRDNPDSKPYQDRKFYSEFTFGQYELSPEIVAKLERHGTWIPVGGLSSRTAERFGMHLINDVYYIFQDMQNPNVEVGDTRITFQALDIYDVFDITVVAKQEGNMLVQHRLRDELYPLGNIYNGIRDARSILDEEESEFAFGKWVLGGLAVVFIIATVLITRANAKYGTIKKAKGIE